MNKTAISFNEEGAGIFKAPASLSLQLNFELVVILALPTEKVCALVRHFPHRPLKELSEQLSMVGQKLKQIPAVRPSDIHVKIFGLSNVNHLVLLTVRRWADQNGFALVSEDVGRSVARSLTVDCASGRVGVQYAEAYSPNLAPILAEGTALHRVTPSPSRNFSVCILSLSNVNRRLCTQAVEEVPGWQAFAPEKPFDWLMDARQWNDCALVLFFEDVGVGKPVERCLSAIHWRR